MTDTLYDLDLTNEEELEALLAHRVNIAASCTELAGTRYYQASRDALDWNFSDIIDVLRDMECSP